MKKLLQIFFVLSLLIIVIYKGIDFLANVFEEDTKKQEEKKYIQLLEDFIKTPTNVPNESVFDGMKRYKMGEWKYLEDKKLYVDIQNNPITGVIEKDTEWNIIITSIKDGVKNGPRFLFVKLEDKQYLWSYDFLNNESPKKLVVFYNNGIPRVKTQHFGDYNIWCNFCKNGKSLYCQLRVYKDPSELIYMVYDRTGRKIEKISTYTDSICFQKNGSQRKLTKEEINSFFDIEKKINNDIANGIDDVEYDLHCE